MRAKHLEAVAADDKQKERNYWLSQLAGEPKKTFFPPDYLQGKSMESSGEGKPPFAVWQFKLPGDIVEKLIQVSQGSDARLFLLLLGGFSALLHKYGGARDIILGAPVVRQEVKGAFINTVLILRCILESDMTFKQLLSTVRQTVSDAVEHQNYPLNTLLYELGFPPLDQEQEFPLLDIALLLENIHDKSYIDHIPLNMRVSFNRTGESIEAAVEYNPRLYRQDTVEQVCRHFSCLLQEALFNPDITLSQLDILSPGEKKQLLHDFNNLEAEYPENKTLHRLFEEQVEKTPDSIALAGIAYITYHLLNKKSNQLVYRLKEKGVQTDGIVGIMIERSLEMIIGILGILKAGGAYLPISLKYPEERIKYLLEDSSASLLLTSETLIKSFCGGSEPAGAVFSKRAPLTAGGKLAYIIYTSGSTGKPKGVMMEHRSVHNLVIGLQEIIYSSCGSGSLNVCLVAPYEFDASVQQIFGALLQGHALYIVPEETRFDGGALLEFYKKYSINISDGTPAHIRLLLEALAIDKKALPLPVDHFIIAGEAFPLARARQFFKSFDSPPRVSNLYGPTETCVDSTFFHISPGIFHSHAPDTVPIGRPLPNQQVYILDKENRLLPIGVPGELCIGGDGVGRGYLNRPELTNKKFLRGVRTGGGGFFKRSPPGRRRQKIYKTGDLARWLTDGNIEFLGRLDHQVKLRGYRIELGEIESRLRNLEVVKEAVVEIRKDTSGDQQLVAFVEPDPVHAGSVKRLLQLEKQGLPPDRHYRQLPNGMPLFYINLHEAENLYREIFEEHSYWQHGISLPEGACVLDLGANIGMFTLFIHHQCKDPVIYSFEPLPPTCDVLRLNTALHGINAKVFNTGISDKEGEETFTYFPNSPAMSGRFANLEEEIDTVRGFMINREHSQEKAAGLSTDQVDEIVEERLTTEQYTCPVTSLSNVIREQGIETIDLLKIDVEKGELDVLAGIEEQDWLKIHRLVIEVHDVDDRLDGIVRQLETRGYKVACQQDTLYKNTSLYNLYALRPGLEGENLRETVSFRQPGPEQLIAHLRNSLKEQLPDYMVPSTFMLLARFPLTANGKIDRKALAGLDIRQSSGEYRPPRSETEKKLRDIWAGILAVEKSIIGIDSDFFQLGGHSLKATVLISHIHKEFNVKLPLAEIFQWPTIYELAQSISRLEQDTYASITPIEKKEYYPLSSAQKRLLVLQRMDAGSTAYNMPGIYLVEGNPAVKKLENTFKKLISRHESLRTSLELIDGEPVQRIHKPADTAFKIREYDAVGKDPDAIAGDFIRAFDLAVPPLLRVGLVKLEKEKHILMLDMHHIISDGASQEILINNFASLYLGEELSPLMLQYRDFSHWQNQRFAGGAFKKQEAYWLGNFPGEIPVLDMPTDYPRPRARHFEGNYIRIDVDREIARTVRRAAGETNATLYMLLLTVYYVLLAKYTGQEDIVVGSPVLGRRHADLDHIIGMFVNTLALRNYPKGEKTFKAFLQEVMENSIKAVDNQDYPFDELVEKLVINRDTTRNPLFNVLFSFSDSPPVDNAGIEFAGLTFKPYDVEARAAKFDFSMEAAEGNGKLVLIMVYCTKLYEKETMERITTDYISILEAITGDITIKIEDIELESVKGLAPRYEEEEEDIQFNL